MSDYVVVRQLGIGLAVVLFAAIVVLGFAYAWSRWEVIAAATVAVAVLWWWDRAVCRRTG